jgi:HSP20 family molecular chaperone IbpA
MFGEFSANPSQTNDSLSGSNAIKSDCHPPTETRSSPTGNGHGDPNRRPPSPDARRARDSCSETGNVTSLLDGLIGLVRSLGEFADKGRQLRHTVGRDDLKVETTVKVRSLLDDYGQPIRDQKDSSDNSESPTEASPPDKVAVKVGGGDDHHDRHAPLTPRYDRFDEPEGVTLLFEIPGVNSLDEVDLELDGNLLFLETTAARRYRVEVMLDQTFDPAGLRSRLTHGVLEVRLNR